MSARGADYPTWLWQVVDEFDRWAHSRLPEVQRLILSSLPRRAEREDREDGQCRVCAGKPWADCEACENTGRESGARGHAFVREAEALKLRWSERQDLISKHGRHAPELFLSRDGSINARTYHRKVAFLARAHDELIAEDPGRRYRQGWAAVVPQLDAAQDVHLATEFRLEDVVRHEKDKAAGLETEIERCWREVREEAARLEGEQAPAAASERQAAEEPPTDVGDEGAKRDAREKPTEAAANGEHGVAAAGSPEALEVVICLDEEGCLTLNGKRSKTQHGAEAKNQAPAQRLLELAEGRVVRLKPTSARKMSTIATVLDGTPAAFRVKVDAAEGGVGEARVEAVRSGTRVRLVRGEDATTR